MKRLAIQLFHDEAGVVVTPEIIIITTVGLLSLIAGWNAVSNALAAELGDVANSVAALDQSYSYRGLSAGVHATCSGGGFADSGQTFSVNPVDVTISGPGADGEITINIPEISSNAANAANAASASSEQEVAVFGVERIEQVNAQGVAVNSAAAADSEASSSAASTAASDEELKSLLTEMEKLCKRVEQLKAARKENK